MDWSSLSLQIWKPRLVVFMSENYREPEDLLSDPSFLSWYYNPGKEDDRTWEDWKAGRPDRDMLIKKAIGLLEAARLPEKEPSPQQLQQAEAALFQRIEMLTPEQPEVRKPSLIGRYRWIAAASVLVLLPIGAFFTRMGHRVRPEVRTDFGQISHRQLPDGTEVMMNANSRISYADDWRYGVDREV